MKTAFWGVFTAGFVACSVLGIGPVLKRMGGNWLSAPVLVGVVLGIAALALAALYATGVRPAFLPTDRAMVYALVGVVAVKVAVGAVAMR